MTLRSFFLERPKRRASPFFRYAFLAFILVLLVADILWFSRRSSHYHGDPYGNLVIAVMLLLNHLAFQFTYPSAATAALRSVAIFWLVFACYYTFYLGRVLYPIY